MIGVRADAAAYAEKAPGYAHSIRKIRALATKFDFTAQRMRERERERVGGGVESVQRQAHTETQTHGERKREGERQRERALQQLCT
eukprot:2341462-Rhodomonas_salina.1